MRRLARQLTRELIKSLDGKDHWTFEEGGLNRNGVSIKINKNRLRLEVETVEVWLPFFCKLFLRRAVRKEIISKCKVKT